MAFLVNCSPERVFQLLLTYQLLHNSHTHCTCTVRTARNFEGITDNNASFMMNINKTNLAVAWDLYRLDMGCAR